MDLLIEKTTEKVSKELCEIFGTETILIPGRKPMNRNFSENGVPGYIDYTKLGATVSRDQVKELCFEASKNHFASICIPPSFVKYAKNFIREEELDTLVATVLSFPYGDDTSRSKRLLVQEAAWDGADEVDMVINISKVLDGDWFSVYEDIVGVTHGVPMENKDVKVIIETCLLNTEQKIAACLIARAAGASFVKTSTGMSTGGATISDIQLMRYVVGKNMGVKASGGIRDLPTARIMIEAGADRIGTSAGLAIVESLLEEKYSDGK